MKAHSIHIGTNYTGTINELSGCENDVRLLASICKQKADSLKKLIGKNATKDKIISTVRNTLHRLEPGDIAFITFSGHGTCVPDESGDEKSKYDQAMVCDDFELLYDDNVAEVIDDRIRGSYVIALLDCCHSATLHRNMHGPRIKTIPYTRCNVGRLVSKYPNPRALRDCGFIAGCGEGPNDYSYDAIFNGVPNGALSYYTVKAWLELPRGSTFNDLFNRIGGKRPKGFLPSDDYPQQPARMGSAKNFARKLPFK